jgi:uncharacterized metal-binding protein
MIFTTFNPYDYPIEREIQDCFICFELLDINRKNPIRLDAQNTYLKICSCDGWIHNKCLNHWCKLNKKCPICRNVMDKHINYAFSIFNEKILKHSFLYRIVTLFLQNYNPCYKIGTIIFFSFSFLLFLTGLFINYEDYDPVDFYPLE